MVIIHILYKAYELEKIFLRQKMKKSRILIPFIAAIVTFLVGIIIISYIERNEDKNPLDARKNEWMNVSVGEHITYGGNITQDQIFLLSVDEVNKYFNSDEERMCGTTDYAMVQGAVANYNYKVDGKSTCYWCLRTPGSSQLKASDIFSGGAVNMDGHGVDFIGSAVRPAMWINLE